MAIISLFLFFMASFSHQAFAAPVKTAALPHETSKSRREALGSQGTSGENPGQKAKEFLAKPFAKNNGAILIKTVKSDKYDRYLADVWIKEKDLNQEVMDQGLADTVRS